MVADVERLEQRPRRSGHFSNRCVKHVLIDPGRSLKPADLADELKRGIVELLVGWGVTRASQSLDVPAHVELPFRSCGAPSALIDTRTAGSHKDLTP